MTITQTIAEGKEEFEKIMPVADVELRNGEWLISQDDARAFLDHFAKNILMAVREEKDAVYHERDMLVCALSKLFPAYLARHSDEDKEWEDDWRWIVYIELPTGQVSWHIHDKERELFNHLEVKVNNWDGHDTKLKYDRLADLSKAIESITP